MPVSLEVSARIYQVVILDVADLADSKNDSMWMHVSLSQP